MTTQSIRHDGLGRLADVMVEDIVETPRDELLAEVAEDYGNAQALSAEFDRLIMPILHKGMVGARSVAEMDQQALPDDARRISANSRQVNFAGQAWTLGLNAWLKALLQRVDSLIPGNFQMAAASLLAVVLVAGTTFLIIKELSSNSVTEQLASSKSPPTIPVSPQPGTSDSAREEEARKAASAQAYYIVQVAEGRSEDEARANYRVLQAKFQSLLHDRTPIIRLDDHGSYLAAVGPFGTLEEAGAFCDTLKSSGAQCTTSKYSL
jgi:SPOR domain